MATKVVLYEGSRGAPRVSIRVDEPRGWSQITVSVREAGEIARELGMLLDGMEWRECASGSCSAWFGVNNTKKRYCSKRCVSREHMRKKRARDEA